MLTNNRDKAEQLARFGIEVVGAAAAQVVTVSPGLDDAWFESDKFKRKAASTQADYRGKFRRFLETVARVPAGGDHHATALWQGRRIDLADGQRGGRVAAVAVEDAEHRPLTTQPHPPGVLGVDGQHGDAARQPVGEGRRLVVQAGELRDRILAVRTSG